MKTITALVSTFFLAGIAALFGNAISFAADLDKLAATAKKDCQPDIQKLCSDVTPGEGRIVECLSSKSDKVSSQCMKGVNALSAEVKSRFEKIAGRFNDACSQDVARWCGRVPAGQGRLLSCLSGRRDDLSQKCDKYLRDASTEIDKMLE
jgi:hypothetical protein